MRLRPLSIILLVVNCGCLATLPKPPKGDLCVLDVQTATGECVHISKVAKREKLDRDDVSSHVSINTMDNWVAFSPDTWANIQVYINDLKEIIKEECQ